MWLPGVSLKQSLVKRAVARGGGQDNQSRDQFYDVMSRRRKMETIQFMVIIVPVGT